MLRAQGCLCEEDLSQGEQRDLEAFRILLFSKPLTYWGSDPRWPLGLARAGMFMWQTGMRTRDPLIRSPGVSEGTWLGLNQEPKDRNQSHRFPGTLGWRQAGELSDVSFWALGQKHSLVLPLNTSVEQCYSSRARR